MPNRISVTIAGQNYTVLAEENEEYTRGVAQRADRTIAEARQAIDASELQAAVLAALNLADEATKAERELRRIHGDSSERLDQVEAMRQEILRLEEENARLKAELAELTSDLDVSSEHTLKQILKSTSEDAPVTTPEIAPKPAPNPAPKSAPKEERHV